MGDGPLQIETVRDFLPVPVHPNGHDVHMASVYIEVLEDDIGLFSIAHAFHKFLGQNNHLVRRQLVLGRWVQREMNNRLSNVGIEVGIVPEGFGALVDMELAARPFRDSLRSEQPAFVVLDSNVVVGQHAVNVAAVIDCGDHIVMIDDDKFRSSNIVYLYLSISI